MSINIDEQLHNADWVKQSWDLVGIDTVEKLRDWLDASGMSVDHFKTLPVYRFNVTKPETAWLKDL